MQNIISFTRKVDSVLKVFYYILIIAFGFSICGLIFILFVPTSILTNTLVFNTSISINFNELLLKLNIEYLSISEFKTIVSIIFIIVITNIIFTILCIYQLRLILKSLKAGTPFEDGISKKIKLLSYIVFGIAIIPKIISGILINTLSYIVNLKDLLNESPIISSVNISIFKINITALLIGIIILLLSKVFEYGTILQHEQDTTL